MSRSVSQSGAGIIDTAPFERRQTQQHLQIIAPSEPSPPPFHQPTVGTFHDFNNLLQDEQQQQQQPEQLTQDQNDTDSGVRFLINFSSGSDSSSTSCVPPSVNSYQIASLIQRCLSIVLG